MTEHIIVTADDWSEIKKDCIKSDSEGDKDLVIQRLKNLASGTDDIYSLGIHQYNGKLFSAGFIGAKCFSLNAQKDIVLYISPRFSVDPYIMLNCVLEDEEYEKYESDRRPLYYVFEREGMIPSSRSDFGGELLLAVSYIKSCEMVCKKILKSRMTFYEENLNGKIKGKIMFSKHIKHNISAGRDDRVYCRYQTFSIDTQENRILKAALIKAVKIINNSAVDSRRKLPAIRKSIRYCMKALNNVRTVALSRNQFVSIKVNGLYSYYKKPIQLAKLICEKGRLSASYNDVNEYKILPYAINMESLFEYYIRYQIRKQDVYLDEYNKKHKYLKTKKSGRHIEENYIPDIVIYNKTPEGSKGDCIGVFDVKYKDHSIPDRNDSHQLMSYVLMFDTGSCGFILPQKRDEDVNLYLIDCNESDVLAKGGFFVKEKAMINTKRDLNINYYEYLVSTKNVTDS